jgi:hypothetical protein
VLPLFPNEETKTAVLAGVREVVGPCYPVSDGLNAAVVELLSSPSTEGDLSAVRAALCERAEARRISTE